MRTVQITVYDIFGFLIPGAVALFGAVLASTAIFADLNTRLYSTEVESWLFFGLISYIIGHATQSVANVVMSLRPSTVGLAFEAESKFRLNGDLIAAVTATAHKITGIPAEKDIPFQLVWDICDHYSQQNCRTENREIYVYREGFYRGMFVATAVLALGASIHSIFSPDAVQIGVIRITWTQPQMAVFAVLNFVMTWLFYQRYRRFGRYLLVHSILNTLICERTGEMKLVNGGQDATD